MRLLEFENTSSGANPQAAILTKKTAKKPAPKAAASKPDRGDPAGGQVLTIEGNNALQQPVRRRPIDLEQLQQRIEVLERRMRARAQANDNRQVALKDLEQLKQRMKLLERSVHNELWAAKQREHTLLEMLARPPLHHLLRDRARHLRRHTLPAACRWCADCGREWWSDNQPLWWPRVAAAWQESLDKARGIDRG